MLGKQGATHTQTRAVRYNRGADARGYAPGSNNAGTSSLQASRPAVLDYDLYLLLDVDGLPKAWRMLQKLFQKLGEVTVQVF